ncbi:unnamed protein product [Phytophthora fragariaefolia]|uniref:Unnamed protein product n=1 Tax=Phytophthora fragariaefolia TaxID=1490495 RepID=A0A9W6Y0J3_9STRA|nr:unnamed protein product [Phytophthora fragariaefolia]
MPSRREQPWLLESQYTHASACAYARLSRVFFAKKNEFLAQIEDLPNLLETGDLEQLDKRMTEIEDGMMKSLVDEGYTLDTMKSKLNIKEKLKTMTPEELEEDGDYKLFISFENYWNKLHPKSD